MLQLDFGRGWRGGQQQLCLLARALEPLGWRSVIVTPAAELAARWRREGLEAVAPRAARRRWRGAALVHAHDGRALGWALMARIVGGATPLVASRRVAFPLSRAGAWKWRRAARVLAVSEFVRGGLLRAGLEPGRVVVAPDAVDRAGLPEPETARRELRARLGISPGRWCLACVSAWTAEKGVGDVLAALPALADLDPLLLLAGSGPLERELRAQAQQLGVAERVIWGAGDASIPETVAAADLFVLPSRAEGLGSSLLLAMALGRAAVAARVGGVPELIRHGENGLLVPPGDPGALAAALRQAAENAAARERWIAAGRAAVEERFTPRELAAATAGAYAAARGERGE